MLEIRYVDHECLNRRHPRTVVVVGEQVAEQFPVPVKQRRKPTMNKNQRVVSLQALRTRHAVKREIRKTQRQVAAGERMRREQLLAERRRARHQKYLRHSTIRGVTFSGRRTKRVCDEVRLSRIHAYLVRCRRRGQGVFTNAVRRMGIASVPSDFLTLGMNT